ncbi:16S rRNA (adenine(1518)-N(6)/adenine(1519)-N(6))-dimethyltransferase RsmA [Candidatus Parcubacteria bacterium]|nr:ribosomal RNA small subunit methyltransferase A [Patescibacteria group bacterium]MBU4466570.1 ribosomal RNA small subunit methyltransferase A [Patescibacteria group bacterium]MCG2688640.1 16S rRNA (adenine(1518)-N(6)/adenine(1519)-N(6))-dimethyltransferase RsmA [Candidatus Parcubacteria bacterium]
MKKPSGQGLKSLGNPQIIKPQKQLGQHWLRQKNVINKIINAGNLEKTDLVIEIGPGLGDLTKELAQKSGKVIAIEKDLNLVPDLKNNLQGFKNIEIVVGDALKTSFENFKDYKVIANLPYYAATHIIRRFLELANKPELMVLMVQKEVGQRICSQPPNMTLLAVSVQIYADAKIVDYVSKQAFWPKPKIDSAIIRLGPRNPELKFDKILFFKIVRAGFSQPRKQLINNLASGLGLPKSQIKDWLLKNKLRLDTRAESLSLENWLGLAKTFAS